MTSLSLATSMEARPAGIRISVLQAIFVLSGFCGLIYESIWTHYLKLFVGHAAYAQTIVLVVFIGGLALGSWLAGRVSDRLRSPLLAYALAEALIGVISLVFHGVYVRVTDWAYSALLPAACSPDSPCIAQSLVAAALIAPQSVLLGTTFPLMTAGVLRIGTDAPGRRVALFYFLNSIGAVAGVIASGFFLIPTVGLPGTLMSAGLLNILVAIGAYFAAKEAPAAPMAARGVTDASSSAGFDATALLLLIAALTGLSSFVYEVVWIRMLSLVIGSSTQSFELMLATFILGLALGGAWIRSRIDGFRDTLRTLAIVQVLMGVVAAGTFPLYDLTFDFLGWTVRSLSKSEGGYVLYSVTSQLIAAAIMLPATFLAGMTLPLITTVLLRGRFGERAVGYVYAANTVGSIVGVIIAVHVAMPLLGAKGALLFAAAIDVALGVWIMVSRQKEAQRSSSLRWLAFGSGALLAVGILAPVSFERTASGVFRDGTSRISADSTVLFHRDGKAATVAVVRQDDSVAIRTNGKPDAAIHYAGKEPSQDEYTMAIAGLLPLAYKPDARRVAVIGFGSGMTTATLLGSPSLERVDTIEIEPEMVNGARLFGDRVAPAFTDPRSRIVIDDAKSYFARGREKYDVIVSEPSNPWVSGVSSLFTVEFYRRVKHHLAEGGLLVQWIQAYEITDALVATILRAIDTEFADYAVYDANDGDVLLVASTGALRAVPDESALRAMVLPSEVWRLQLHTLADLESRRVAGRRVVRPVLPYLGEGVNSDYHPIVDHLAPKARFMKNKADALSQIAVAPVPLVEMLEGRSARTLESESLSVTHPGARRRAIANARLLASWFQNGSGGGLPEPWAMDVARDAALVRAYLWNCAPIVPGTTFVDGLLVFAGEINPHLSPQAAGEVWAAAQAAPCYKRLSADERTWFELVRAVGARAPERMAALGRELLAAGDALAVSRREYAMLAASTGLLALGRHREARELLDTHLAKLPATRSQLPWTRALKGYSAQAPA